MVEKHLSNLWNQHFFSATTPQCTFWKLNARQREDKRVCIRLRWWDKEEVFSKFIISSKAKIWDVTTKGGTWGSAVGHTSYLFIRISHPIVMNFGIVRSMFTTWNQTNVVADLRCNLKKCAQLTCFKTNFSPPSENVSLKSLSCCSLS